MTAEYAILAKKARWTYKSDESGVIGFTGTFAATDAADAQALRKFLKKEDIVTKQFTIDEDGSTPIIRLSAGKGHDIEKFRKWAMKHDLVPALAADTARLDAKARTHCQSTTPQSPVYHLLPGDEVRELLARQAWQVSEAGYSSEAPPAPQSRPLVKQNGISTTTTNPALAYQIGYYLCKKGLLPKKEFEQLNEQIHEWREGDAPTTFRIAISAAHRHHFAQEFSHAGQLDLPGSTAFTMPAPTRR